MSAEFVNLQEALMGVFGPIIAWLLVLLVASGFLSGLFVMWMRLLARLSAKPY